MSSRGNKKKEWKAYKENQYNKTMKWYDNVISKLQRLENDNKG